MPEFTHLHTLLIALISFLLCIIRNQIAYHKNSQQQTQENKPKFLISKVIKLGDKAGYKELLALSHLLLESFTILGGFIYLQSLSFPPFVFYSSLIGFVTAVFIVNYLIAPFIAHFLLNALPYFSFPLFICYYYSFIWIGLFAYYFKFFLIRLKSWNKNNHQLDSYNLPLTHSFEEEEAQFISNIIRLKSLKVQDILTPKNQIFGIEIKTSYPEILSLLKKTSYTRIPIYQKNLDHILGIFKGKRFVKHTKRKYILLKKYHS